MKLSLYLFCCMTTSIACALEKITYQFCQDPLDVVIVAHEKDSQTLMLAIEGIRKYVRPRAIIVISEYQLTDQALWFDEALFPFTKQTVALEIFNQDTNKAQSFLNHPKTRIGWIYQQLCKLYALFIIPGISDNILIVDADTIFLHDVSFQNNYGEPFFSVATEYNIPYFEHISRVLPQVKKMYKNMSGVTHHMLFQRCIMQDLFDRICDIHHKEPWKVLCHCIDHKDLLGSCMSEYELYFNFACMRTDQIHIRPLRWTNISLREYKLKRTYCYHAYDYVSCHSYL